jgi:hypothetical protein
MIILAYFCIALCVSILAFNIASMGLTALKCRERPRTMLPPLEGAAGQHRTASMRPGALQRGDARRDLPAGLSKI